MPNEPLTALMEAVQASAKYHSVCNDLVARIGAQELGKRRSLKEAIKATKNRLHQVGGAFLGTETLYDDWLERLRLALHAGDQSLPRETCRGIMSYHASTRERLPLLDRFYTEIFALLPPVHSVLDIACGLHPLAIPWMPLAEDAAYYACDMYTDMTDFLQAWMAMLPIQGQAWCSDVLQACPTQRTDMAFLLKAVPCLEQIDPAAGQHLLRDIQADYLVVSFPARSLGGRPKGMVEHYETRFSALLAEVQRWHIIGRLEFTSELVFVMQRIV
jgi:16S rRNA (guanine(1405)-N(7))-methyltransferase